MLVNEVKNQILSTSHALAVLGLMVSLTNLTDLRYVTELACDCQRNGYFIQ